MTVLVTGANGFFGVHLIKGLAECGDRVINFHRSPTPEEVPHFLVPHLDQVVFVQGDVLDLPQLRKAVAENEVDEIIHAATITATSLEVEQNRPREVIEVNVMGSVNIFEVAREYNIRRTVYLSSMGVYHSGRNQKPHFEDEPPEPIGLYGISKVASEIIAQRYRNLFDVSIVSVRMSQPYGPMEVRSRGRVVLSPICEWTHQALRGEEIMVESLDASMDWCYVTDIASGVLTILKGSEPKYDIYNLGSGRLTSVQEVLEALAEMIPGLRYREVSEIVPNPNIDKRYATGHLDIQRAQDEYNYQPTTDIRNGIRHYVEWQRRYGKLDT